MQNKWNKLATNKWSSFTNDYFILHKLNPERKSSGLAQNEINELPLTLSQKCLCESQAERLIHYHVNDKMLYVVLTTLRSTAN